MEVQMIRRTKNLFLVILIIITVSGATFTQDKDTKPADFQLTIDNIMKGPELIGTAPSSIMWSVDGKKLYFRWQAWR
jgi:hypothetical protein